MRQKLIVVLSITVLAVLLAPLTGASPQRQHVDDRDYTEREDINQTYELAPGARVELSVISGSVDVETTSGNTAEVHIVRMGETRKDLDCYTVAIEHTPTSLIMRHKQERTDECQIIRAKQQVMLRLPRNVDLKLSIPRMSERGIRVSGISGKVEFRLASDLNADLNVSGINGDVNAAAPNVTINKVGHSNFAGKVGSGGSVISVSGISGSVTFRSE